MSTVSATSGHGLRSDNNSTSGRQEVASSAALSLPVASATSVPGRLAATPGPFSYYEYFALQCVLRTWSGHHPPGVPKKRNPIQQQQDGCADVVEDIEARNGFDRNGGGADRGGRAEAITQGGQHPLL